MVGNKEKIEMPVLEFEEHKHGNKYGSQLLSFDEMKWSSHENVSNLVEQTELVVKRKRELQAKLKKEKEEQESRRQEIYGKNKDKFDI